MWKDGLSVFFKSSHKDKNALYISSASRHGNVVLRTMQYQLWRQKETEYAEKS
jgi:hypothetical protein